MTGRMRLIVFVGALSLMLWWLRDPAWLADYTEGLSAAEPSADSRTFRWTAGRASFYVPSTWSVADLEMAGTDEFKTQASIFVDGRLAGRLLLDERWQDVPVATGATTTSRRHRRIDVHVARTSEGQRGVRLSWPVREQPQSAR